MSKRAAGVVLAKLLGATIALAPFSAVAQIGGTGTGTSKDKIIANPGGGCERDFAAKPGETAGMGGCDDLFGDGTRGVKRNPKPAQPADQTPSSKSAKPEPKKKATE